MKFKEKYPNIALEWHKEKNELDLDDITYGSHRDAWWICSKCGHEFCMRVQCRGKGCGCPVCKRGKKLQPISETHRNLKKEWHPRNTISSDEVTAGSHKRVWWLGGCGHEWEAHIHNRARQNKPMGCPFCANRAVDQTNSLRARCPKVSEEWHPTKNGETTPDNVNYRSYKRVWWKGNCGHEWETLVRTRTRKVRPAGCPVCKDSKGEQKIEEVLIKLEISYQKQVRFSDCRGKNPLPFDFHVGVNTLIEYQGIQHYEPVNFGGDYKKTFADLQEHDRIKREWCKDNGYKLIEIAYHQFEDIESIVKNEV